MKYKSNSYEFIPTGSLIARFASNDTYETLLSTCRSTAVEWHYIIDFFAKIAL